VAKSTEYHILLSEEDALRCELTILEGKVTGLLLQYEAHLEGEWHPVVRYDTSHGFLHRHRFWLPETRQTDDLEDPDQPSRDYTAAFDAAKKDLNSHWKSYRKAMEKAWSTENA
jgi:hypothetical protein